jgi:thiol-disulfide isomerase/thioredoxin
MAGRGKILFGLLITAAVLLAIREPLMFSIDLGLVLRQDAPHPAEIKRLLRDDARRHRVLDALWSTGKIPHRDEAMRYLKSRAVMEQEFVLRHREILREGVADPDQSVRRCALQTLKMLDDPLWRDASRWFLTQGDGGLALEGLYLLRRHRVTNSVAEIAMLLNDPAPTTAAMAGLALGSLAGADLGLDSGMGRRPAGMAEADWTQKQRETEAALVGARRWWSENATRWPSADPKQDQLFVAVPRSLPPMTLSDSGLNEVSLARYRGKPVVLFFFVTFCGGCQMMLPEIHALRAELPPTISVLPVSLDAVPDDHNHFVELNMIEEGHEHHGHGHGHDHGHHEPGPEPAEVAKVSAKKAERLVPGLNPFFDLTGGATEVLSAGEVPTVIVLDEEGRLVRRMTGIRSKAELLVLLRHLFPKEVGGNKEG